ncbi:MAG: hypothetical protein BWK76_07425 [Desulfobulbaceae bacterium A2]|nr:MAG: hypothetical protein BWK76_07425 [Desulfobulbaceae bacterium A2]
MLQAVSQQVRAWVAEEPALTTAEQRTGVATRIIKQADQSLRNRREEVSMPPQAGPGPGRHPSAQGGAEYHVHLAIGPVSVNMTSTAPRTRKVETGADTPARGQGPDAASRLRRRYLLC